MINNENSMKEILHMNIIMFVGTFRWVEFPDDVVVGQFGIKLIIDFSVGIFFDIQPNDG